MMKFLTNSLLLGFVILMLSNCVEISQDLGQEYIPKEQDMKIKRVSLKGADFGSFITADLDSFSTAKFRIGALGRITTGEFGYTNVGFMSQLLPGVQDGFKLPHDAVVDSIVLNLSFSGRFGLATNDMKINVYRVTKDILDTLYFANDDYSGYYDTNPIMTKVVSRKDKSVQLVVKAGESGFDELKAGLTALETDTVFRETFKGLYIAVEDEDKVGGNILSVNMISEMGQQGTVSTAPSMLHLHYKYFHPTAGRDTVAQIPYLFWTSDNRFMVVDHTAVPPIATDVNYIQGLFGKGATMTFNADGIKSALSGIDLTKIAINRAELRFKINHPTNLQRLDSLYTPQLYTYLKEHTTKGAAYYQPSIDLEAMFALQQQQQNSYFDGSINRTTGSYTIEITHTINNAIRYNKWDKPLYIIPQSYGIGYAWTELFNNSAGIDQQPELIITYAVAQ